MSAAIEDSSVPRLARGVRLRHDDARDAWVLLAPERVLQPDPVAVEILKRVDGEKTFSAIIDDLAQAFAAQRGQIEGDVRAFLDGLIEKGMLEIRTP